MKITPAGGRVIGCLVEKQLTTPQHYPLTRNALALACSQSTNRDPVVSMDEADVGVALESLRGHRLVRFVQPSSGRVVERIRHVLDEVYGLDIPELAALSVLLLRGPQTPGEIRGRAARMVEMADVSAVQGVLERLASRPEPLVELLARRPGQKEDRWRQLLAKEWDADPARDSAQDSPAERDEPNTTDTDRADAPGRYGIADASADPTPALFAAETGQRDTPVEDIHAGMQRQIDELLDAVARLEGELTTLRDNLGG